MDPLMFGMFATRQDNLDKAVELFVECEERDLDCVQMQILAECGLGPDITSSELEYIQREVNKRI